VGGARERCGSGCSSTATVRAPRRTSLRSRAILIAALSRVDVRGLQLDETRSRGLACPRRGRRGARPGRDRDGRARARAAARRRRSAVESRTAFWSCWLLAQAKALAALDRAGDWDAESRAERTSLEVNAGYFAGLAANAALRVDAGAHAPGSPDLSFEDAALGLELLRVALLERLGFSERAQWRAAQIPGLASASEIAAVIERSGLHERLHARVGGRSSRSARRRVPAEAFPFAVGALRAPTPGLARSTRKRCAGSRAGSRRGPVHLPLPRVQPARRSPSCGSARTTRPRSSASSRTDWVPGLPSGRRWPALRSPRTALGGTLRPPGPSQFLGRTHVPPLARILSPPGYSSSS
jgi:hypothetical protein